jgi:hypothetical protein
MKEPSQFAYSPKLKTANRAWLKVGLISLFLAVFAAVLFSSTGMTLLYGSIYWGAGLVELCEDRLFPVQFDSVKWRQPGAAGKLRKQMFNSLMQTHNLIGMSASDIYELLGKPDEPDPRYSKPSSDPPRGANEMKYKLDHHPYLAESWLEIDLLNGKVRSFGVHDRK